MLLRSELSTAAQGLKDLAVKVAAIPKPNRRMPLAPQVWAWSPKKYLKEYSMDMEDFLSFY